MEHIFITFSEAIELLRLSRQTINRLIARGEIPNYKVGKRRLFDREELIEWVKSHREHKGQAGASNEAEGPAAPESKKERR